VDPEEFKDPAGKAPTGKTEEKTQEAEFKTKVKVVPVRTVHV